MTVLTVAGTLTSCGTISGQQTAMHPEQEAAPVFVFDNGEAVRSTTTTVATASSQVQTTPIMRINPDGSVTQSGTIAVTTLPPEALGADLSALQIEVINWRTFQRKASAGVHGETPEQSECMIATSIRALPEELLPELTNPSQAKAQMSTVELWLEELELAKVACL